MKNKLELGTEKKINIALFGSFSANNKGDLGILISMIDNMLKINRNVNIFVPSKNPRELAKFINKKNVKVYRTVTAYLGLSSLKYINKSDILVFGGGGLFFDQKFYNPFFSHSINIFFLTALSKLFSRKTIYLFSVGASHLRSPIALFATKLIINNAHHITARDNNTFHIFSKISKKEIKMHYDPAFLLEKRTNKYVDDFIQSIGTEKKIIFAVNYAVFNYLNKNNSINELVHVINKLQKYYQIVLFHNSNHCQSTKKLFRLCDKKRLKLFSPKSLGPDEIIYFFSKFDFAICAPMHSAIFAYNAGVKIITIEYDDKVKEFNKIINNQNSVNLNELDKIFLVLDNYKDIDMIRRENIKISAINNFHELNKVIKNINKK